MNYIQVPVQIEIGSPNRIGIEIGGVPSMAINIGNVQIVQGEYYEGSYTVTPTADGFTLPTAEKVMADDLTVSPVPYRTVANPQGGNTVTICGDEIVFN